MLVDAQLGRTEGLPKIVRTKLSVLVIDEFEDDN